MKEKMMFANVPLSVVYPVTLALIVIGINLYFFVLKPRIQDRREKRNKEYATQCDQILKSFAGRKFHVSVRTVQNTKTDMETALVGVMVYFGARVVSQKPEEGDTLTLTAVYQVREHLGLATRMYDHWFDLRVSTTSGEILAAKNVWGEDEQSLAFNSLVYLASALK